MKFIFPLFGVFTFAFSYGQTQLISLLKSKELHLKTKYLDSFQRIEITGKLNVHLLQDDKTAASMDSSLTKTVLLKVDNAFYNTLFI